MSRKVLRPRWNPPRSEAPADTGPLYLPYPYYGEDVPEGHTQQCADIDPIPTKQYKEANARHAMDDALFVLDKAGQVLSG